MDQDQLFIFCQYALLESKQKLPFIWDLPRPDALAVIFHLRHGISVAQNIENTEFGSKGDTRSQPLRFFKFTLLQIVQSCLTYKLPIQCSEYAYICTTRS